MTTPDPQNIPGHTILKGTITATTEKAIRIIVDTVDGEEWTEAQKTFWIPISQIHSHWESRKAREDWILITDWLANKIGFV